MRRWIFAAACLSACVALSACNSAKDVLEPSAVAPTEQSAALARSEGTDVAAPAVTGTATTAAAAAVPAQTAAVVSKARVQFAPIVGATVEAATPLTQRLGTRARERGITLAGSTDTAPPGIIMRGYFSAMTEGKDTTVVYVWDVYDPAGTRLHRINGQQTAASAGSGEGWPAVAPATMQAIADSTIDQLALWLAAKPG
ncbi:hypothetical protein EDC40_102477 [Aminobacter aminovorans]|jgi:pyruvate/2-oxoglutarate dehydrogenase complex dihydrolipoamide acyltransferase (E2) component|uniref:Lipoprotein n=1 Tax=Aminobacter aminovorans TaxID=83263 RepID=A0A380WKV1_AMIAI|nr:hypothetical protein [Aminobacter aminovorans]TCS29033.1 hypothetical protein EDC40_102477 [Aminobacter aminovorans]SUU88886.1 Uncharacterised protein [Aminobacter aminovorans]